MTARGNTAVVLFAAMFAAQAAVIAMAPVLAQVAADLGVDTATAGQLRTLSSLVAAVTGFQIPRVANRIGLRAVLLGGTGLIAAGSLASALAQTFVVLAVAQALCGIAFAAVVVAGTAAAAAWAGQVERAKVLSWALIGQPAAWIVGMPLVGALGRWSWRLGWLALPLASAVVATLLLLRSPAKEEHGFVDARARSILSDRAIARWALAELLFGCGWAGTLVYVGALFADSYGTSTALTGVVLAGGASMFVAGNLAVRRVAERQPQRQLVALALLLAVLVASLGVVRTDVWLSGALFFATACVAGARTLVGSATGLGVRPQAQLAAMGLRTVAVQVGSVVGAAAAGIALAAGGYAGLGLCMSVFFAGAAASLVQLRVTVSRVPVLGEA